MKKVVLLPLDERPCNYNFPLKLFSGSFNLVLPDKSILGDKKKSADKDAVAAFIQKECADADCLVVSLEMLLYGGLLPSRLHFENDTDVNARLNILKQLKDKNKKLKIYAFSLIMRCPRYSSSDEEPDYYGECGSEIHQIGVLKHKLELGIIDKAEYQNNMDKLNAAVKAEYLSDYLSRRKFNLEYNKKSIQFLSDGVIDYLVVPQDDSAEYGFTSIDREEVLSFVSQLNLKDSFINYPGADEVALTLLSRYLNFTLDAAPKIKIEYPYNNHGQIIPLYEDRPFYETVQKHILAAGCSVVQSVADADFALFVTAPDCDMDEAAFQPSKNLSYTNRRLDDMVERLNDYIVNLKVPCVVCDNAYANGADLKLIQLLNEKNLLLKCAGYAGWNTSSNTLGTCLAQGVTYVSGGKDKQFFIDFLVERFLEDAGYCSVVRKAVSNKYLEKLGYNYFDVAESSGKVADLVKTELINFKDAYLTKIATGIIIEKIAMPWKRMFEVDITAKFKPL